MALLDSLMKARVFDLEQPRFAGMPVHPAHKPGYFYGLHRRHRDSYKPEKFGPRSGSSGVLTMMEHSGTHIDALCHQASDLKFFKGIEVEQIERADGYQQLGAETIRPLLARGVMLDVAKWKKVDRLPPNYGIGADDLQGCARAQNVEVKPGDVLIVRTGFGACWTDEATYLSASGVSKSGNIWAADHKVVAVGADNMAWDSMEEKDPETNMMLFGHVHLLVTHGIHIIENLYLEILSSVGHHEFCFVGVPLKFRGATGSPIRPLALVEA